MKFMKIEEMKKGWFIGNFEPSLFKTEQFEVAVHNHKKNEYHAPHFHKIATEYNVIIDGEILVNENKLSTGDIFIAYPNDITDVEFITDCTIVVVKVPSVAGDKYIVEKN